jgi:predicted phage tail protein
MTTINLHGILAHEFGNSFLMHIKKPKQVVDAIDANKRLFKKRILELSEQGIHYAILVDGQNINSSEQLELKKENMTIDVVPMVCGSGFVALVGAIGGAIAAGATAGSFAAVFGGFLASQLGSALIGGVLNMVVGTLIQQALAPSDKPQRTESTVSGAKESFIFSSKANLTQQGNPVPVGYGRLRVGSSVVQSTVKSYPQAYQAEKALVGTSQDAAIRQTVQ